MSTKNAKSDPSDLALQQHLQEFANQFFAINGYSVDDYFATHPHLRGQTQLAVALIFEAYCLHRDAGEQNLAEQLIDRYPEWTTKLQVMVELDELLHEEPQCQFPDPDGVLGPFKLLKEIGASASSRVYLATQPQLSDRPLVVKMSAHSAGEHLSLARLQHTAIVPLYFAEDEQAENQRVLAMPFLGGATFFEIFVRLRERGKVNGARIIECLDYCNARWPELDGSGVVADGPARSFLSSVSFEKALCWLFACLAEGLHYAHQRGIVHLDIKPSNLLLAADGQPMLLDFHLAKHVEELASSCDSLGGTPGFMSPEQEAAMSAIESSPNATVHVDERSDIYSLGLVLVSALDAAGLNRKDIGRGLDLVLDRCLAPNPTDRYDDAGILATELRKLASQEPKPRLIQNRWLQGFVAGVLLTASIGLPTVWTESKSVAPAMGRRQLNDELLEDFHSLMLQIRQPGRLQSVESMPAERKQLVQLLEGFLARREAMLYAISAEQFPARHARLRTDLADAEKTLERLQANE